MKNLKFITPASTEELEWDAKSHQYLLKIEYVKDQIDVNYGDDEILKKRIRENSRLIYRFIKNRVHSYNRKLVNNVLENTEEGREFIKELLLTQLEADNETGYNDLSKTPAINIASNQVIDRNELYRNQVCVDVEQIFDDSDSYFGFRIGYQSPFPAYLFVYLRKGA